MARFFEDTKKIEADELQERINQLIWCDGIIFFKVIEVLTKKDTLYSKELIVEGLEFEIEETAGMIIGSDVNEDLLNNSYALSVLLLSGLEIYSVNERIFEIILNSGIIIIQALPV
jgi:hypothetical protein